MAPIDINRNTTVTLVYKTVEEERFKKKSNTLEWKFLQKRHLEAKLTIHD